MYINIFSVLIGLGTCFFLFFKPSEKKQANIILGVLIFTYVYTVISQIIKYQQWYFIPWIIRSDDPLPFLFGPLSYLYMRSVIKKQPLSWPLDLPHFLPFFFYCMYLIPWFLSSPETRINAEDNAIERALINISKTIASFIYLFLFTLPVVKWYRKQDGSSFFSMKEGKLITIPAIPFGVLLIYLLIEIIQSAGLQVKKYSDAIIYTYATAMFYYAFVLMITEPGLFFKPSIKKNLSDKPVIEDIPEDCEESLPSVKYQKSRLSEEKYKEYTELLFSYIKESKPHLDSELTINVLSESLGISTHNLSQVINEKLNKSFSDYINELRINEVKKCLVDTKYDHLTILSIALDCGFRTKSSFNSIFKKITGTTPSEFRSKSR